MLAIKARFDGKQVVLPPDVRDVPPGDVIVVFENVESHSRESSAWMKAQEAIFATVWDNDEDAVYDSL